jgi:RNA polymerase sigma-70 factor, ECF subfamily
MRLFVYAPCGTAVTRGGRVFGVGFDNVLLAARGGDESAWTRLYLDLAPVITGYLKGHRCPQPEDVASETLLQVVRDLQRFDGDESAFRSWVFTVAHHRMIDAHRHHSVRPCDPTDGQILEAALPVESWEEHAVAHLGVAELEHLLEATSRDQREVLLLRYVADLSLHEAAEVLGKEYNTVKALHRRGINALRAHIAGAAYPSTRSRALTTSG